MDLITWNENFSVGVPRLDAQHKRLVQQLNDLQAAVRRGDAVESLRSVLGELVRYTQQHFADEERLMTQANYPYVGSHKAKHFELTEQVKQFVEKLESGQTAISARLTSFLRDWLQGHILSEDKKYSACLKRALVGA